MTALIDLGKCRDYTSVSIDQKQYIIKLAGTVKHPYFCGKDVCDILEQKDSKYALKTHVPNKYKRELSSFYSKKDHNLGGGIPPPQTVDVDSQRLGKSEIMFREGQTVYISEPGLYSLIMNSKTKFATTFQELVLETILPSIREYGSFQIEQQLVQKMNQLSIKEKSEEKLKQQARLDRAAREIAEQQEQLCREALEIEKYERDLDQRYTNKLRDIVTVMKTKQRNQIIYIATTKAYAKQNRFKVGGVKSRTLLKGRLATYNTGRPVGDKMYFAYISETTDYHHLEQRIKKIIADHIDADEMYSLHYDSLHPLIEYLADRFNDEVDYHKTLFESLVKETITKAPRVPEPILLNGAEFRKIRNGEVVSVQRVDFDELPEHERMEFVTSVFEEFCVFRGDVSNLQRKEFEDYITDQHKTKFSKRTLWNVTKVVAENLRRRIKY